MNSLSLLNLYLFGRLRKRPRFCNTSTGFLVCYTAVFRVVTQRSPPGEEPCVTTLKMAV